LAYAGLARSYALFTYYGVESPGESCPKAKAAAMKAIEIDGTLAEAHAALGLIRLGCDWNSKSSESEFRKALEISPNDANTTSSNAAYLKAMGKVEESVTEYQRALEADPVNLINNAALGRDLYLAGHDDRAAEQLRRTIEMDPSFVEAHYYLGWIFEHKGMFAEAIAELRQALNLSGGDPRFVSALGHAYAISGQRKLAEESLDHLQEQRKQRYVAAYDIAVIYAGLKDMEQTLKYLEMAYQDRSFWMIWLRIDPRFDGIRGDPRYQDILRRMHLNP